MKIRGFFFALFTFSVFLFVSGDATAELVKIGNATFEGQPYNLIYDEDQELIWLDYTHSRANWSSQMNWAAGLNESGVLTYDIDPKYTVFWNEEDLWRLPGVDENVVYLPNIASDCDRAYCWGYWGPDDYGKYDYLWGYNIVNSEILHLYYKSFGNKGYRGTDGYPNQPGWGLLNTGPFINLYPVAYHSGTLASEYIPFYFAGQPYVCNMKEGYQIIAGHKEGLHFAIAVRPGQVSAVPTDSDNDGVPDDSDNCPESDLCETVIIDACDTGVENTLFDDGCTMSDLIDELADNADNQGQFVSSVSHLTNDWKKERLISGKEKGAIMKCAAKATILDCNIVTVSGKIRYNGPPIPDVLVRLVENTNGTVLDTTRTGSNGKFSFTFEKIEGVQEYGVDVQPEGMVNALTGWRGFRLFDENCENVLPDFDMYFEENILFPPDGATISADAISESNPIIFQWSERSDVTSYSAAINSSYEVWGRYFFPEPTISFNGTLDDGTKIVPGTYIWWYWLNFGPEPGDEYWQFWGSQNTGKTLIITE